MAETTDISWTDATFNPWTGCTKVSPGCGNCYAEHLMDHRMHKVQWGHGMPRVRTSAANWRKPAQWNTRPFCACPVCGWRGDGGAVGLACSSIDCSGKLVAARRRVFCASLADVFDNEVPREWRADLFTLIRYTPNLDWLLLTKRIGNAANMIAEAMRDQGEPADETAGWPWPNVWLGATIVNQEEADRDIPKLLATPARVRFLSMEPLLGPVDLKNITPPGRPMDMMLPLAGLTWTVTWSGTRVTGAHPKIDWVIVGGESGPGARPLNIAWVRSLVQQCQAAGTAAHVKQLGARVMTDGTSVPGQHWPGDAVLQDTGLGLFVKHLAHKKGGDITEWPADLRVQEFPGVRS